MVQPPRVRRAVVVPDALVLFRVRVTVHVDVDVVLRGGLLHAAQKHAGLVDVPGHPGVQGLPGRHPCPVVVGQVLVHLFQQGAALGVLVLAQGGRVRLAALAVGHGQLPHPHRGLVQLCQLRVAGELRLHVLQRQAAVQDVVHALLVLQLQRQLRQLVVGDLPRLAAVVFQTDVHKVMGKVVKFLLVGRPGQLVKHPRALDQDLCFLPLAVVQHFAQVLHVAAVGVPAQPLKHPFNVHGVHLIAVQCPAHPAKGARLFAHAFGVGQLAFHPLGEFVDHHVLGRAHHHVVGLDDVQRLVNDVPQPSQFGGAQGGHAAVFQRCQSVVQSVHIRRPARAFILPGVLLCVLDLRPQHFDLPFPVVVHVQQPLVNGVLQAAVLPFQLCPVAVLHLPLDAVPQPVHRFFHGCLAVLHGRVGPALFAPVRPLGKPLGRLPVSNGLVRQLQNRLHLVQKVLRHILFLVRVLEHLGQLTRRLADGPPGVVLVPAVPHLGQPLGVLRLCNGNFLPGLSAFCLPQYSRLLFQLPLLRAKLCLCPCGRFLVVLLGLGHPVRIGLPHLLPVAGPLFGRVQVGLGLQRQAVPLCLFVHLLGPRLELRPQFRVPAVGHARQAQVFVPQIHGQFLLGRVPFAVIGALHRGLDRIVCRRHGFQRVGGAAGRFGGEQSPANALQLGKVGVPPAHLALFRQRQAHAVLCQLLPGLGPAAVLVQHLVVVLAAFFQAHAHLVQVGVGLPQLVVFLGAAFHHLLGHVQHKAVGLGPVHAAAAQVVPQCGKAAGQGLHVRPAVAGLHHLPGNAFQAFVRHLCRIRLRHHLGQSLGLSAAVPHALAPGCFHVLAVHVQLVAVFSFLRHKLCKFCVAGICIHHLDRLSEVC